MKLNRKENNINMTTTLSAKVLQCNIHFYSMIYIKTTREGKKSQTNIVSALNNATENWKRNIKTCVVKTCKNCQPLFDHLGIQRP